MQPLAKSIRIRILLILVVIFFLGTPILIGYSVGYRIDDALSLVRTGGIFIHSELSNTVVYLDGEFVEENGAILRNTLIQDLIPEQTYEVWVERAGYQSWTKDLLVQPNLVTEAHVMMLPDSFIWEPVEATTTLRVAANVETDAVTSTSTATSTEVANPRYLELNRYFAEHREQFEVEVATTTYVMRNTERVATTTIIRTLQFPDWMSAFASSTRLSEKSLVRERDGIVTWLQDGTIVASWARPEDPHPYFLCHATCTDMVVVDWDELIDYYMFYPNRNDALIVGSERGIFAVELDARTPRNIQPIVVEPELSFRIRDDDELIIYDGTQYRITSW